MERSRIDWRGWIAVAWAVGWGVAYVLTTISARGPQAWRWIGHLGGGP